MDQVTRSAARIAALAAVPVALLVGIGVFALLSSQSGEPTGAGTSPVPTGPVGTGPVATDARELTEREEVVCRALLSNLPDEVDGQVQRPVTAGPEQNAAYGDPPVTVACGVPAAAYPPTDTIFPLPGGVCWHATEGPDGSVWTTVDREVPVRLAFPASYDGPGQLATALSTPVAESILSAEDAPSRC